MKSIDGLQYKKIVTNKNKTIHVFEINRDKFEIISAHASSINKEKATVYNIAKHSNAILGINGGFFKVSKDHTFVSPAGILKIKDKWHGIAYNPRGAIGWSNNNIDGKGYMIIDVVETKTLLHIDGLHYKVNIFNPVDQYTKGAIFSRGFLDLINISDCNLKIHGNTVTQVNSKIKQITNNEYAFSMVDAKQCNITDNLLYKHAYLDIHVYPKFNMLNHHAWNKLEYIVGGAPVLIYNGKKNIFYKKEVKNEDFLHHPHARTAIGILKNHNLVIVVVEQNLSLNILGLTIPELASFMESLGCVAALNLDGGGSTSLYVAAKIEKALNVGELGLLQNRPVTDAILVMPIAN